MGEASCPDSVASIRRRLSLSHYWLTLPSRSWSTYAEQLASARPGDCNFDFRASVASVVNYIYIYIYQSWFYRHVSCRVHDLHDMMSPTSELSCILYREKGCAARHGTGDLSVLHVPVIEHSRLARILCHFIRTVQLAPDDHVGCLGPPL